MSRPWSPAEIEEKLPELVEQIEDAITDLRDLGIAAARTEHAYRKAKAVAYLKVSGKNAEERESRALLHQTEPGVTVVDLALERDLAENAYRNQRTKASLLETEAKLIQTMHVSHRAVDGSKR